MSVYPVAEEGSTGQKLSCRAVDLCEKLSMRAVFTDQMLSYRAVFEI